MIINHNVPALNTYNKLTVNNNQSAKALEKLSSGLRINRAGDDAAGLAISEKMRAQIRGLDQAGSNAQNAISLVQTAEGGLNETHSILQRMRELSVQSATDTNTADDRQKIQSEIDQLAREITRISNTTEFNTQNLLAGGFNGVYHIGANSNQNLRMNINAMDAFTLGVAASAKSADTFTAGANSGISSVASIGRGLDPAKVANGNYTVKATVTVAAATNVVLNYTAGTAVATAAGMALSTVTGYTGTLDKDYIIKVDTVAGSATTGSVTGILYSTDGGVTYTKASLDNTSKVVIDGITLTFSGVNNNIGDVRTFNATAAKAELQLYDGLSTTGTLIGNTAIATMDTKEIIVGDTVSGRTVTLNFDMTKATAAAVDTTFKVNETKSSAALTSNGYVARNADAVLGIDVSSQGAANKAISAIDKAINTVSEERSKIGALQNRLEYTISNLATSSENLTAAESRIRDVDMAKEMMNYQKNMILSQAATSMLAQANQMPQNVLKLLG